MTMQPIDHPCVWRGEEIVGRADWRRDIASGDVERLVAWAANSDAAAPAPPAFAGLLRQVQHDLEHGSGACLLRGAPFDALSEDQIRRLFSRSAELVGTPVSQSADGETVFSVRDEGYSVDHPKARGPNTKKRLSFHSDRCDVIAFACLRPAASGGENQIVSAAAVFNELLATQPDVVATLMQPFYYQRHNVDVGNERPWCRQPVFSFCEGRFAASYLRVLINRAHASPDLPDLSREQVAALDALEATCARPEMHYTFRLERGDLLFLNNWVVLHRREEFTDHADPQLRRHFLRMWLSPPNSRPIDPLFLDNFGATAAGAPRGGMRAVSDSQSSGPRV